MAIKQSISPTLGAFLQKYLIGALTVAPSPLIMAGATLRLYSARTAPISRDIAPTDLTECTFTGYAPVAGPFTPQSTILNPSGNGWGWLNNASFVQTGTGVTENVQGYFVVDSTGNNIIIIEDFDAPVPMIAIGDFISLDFAVPQNDTLAFA